MQSRYFPSEVARIPYESHPYELQPATIHSISNPYEPVMPHTALAIAALIALTATLFIVPEQSHAQSVEIPPSITMTLSGGSGTGTGDEGPDRLTRDKIDITVTSDEPLQEPPSISVVCNDIRWIETVDGETVERNIDDFIANRTGNLGEVQSAHFNYRCGQHENDITLETHAMTATGTMSWTYQWRNSTEAPHKLNDGLLTAVAHARDRSEDQLTEESESTHNNASTSANFTLDTVIKSPLAEDGGIVYLVDRQPLHDGECHSKPGFQFNEKTDVVLDSVVIDPPEAIWFFKHDEINGEYNRWNLHSKPFPNRWPPANFAVGVYNVSVAASDTAGNSVDFDFSFEILPLDEINARRDPFIIDLVPGWNAISFPAPPIDDDFEKVFGNDSVRIVFQWFGNYGFSEYEPKWNAAIREDDRWQPVPPFRLMTGVSGIATPLGGSGMWVYSHDAVKLSVRLQWPTSLPWCIEGIPEVVISELLGWNFVGVHAPNRHHVHEVTFGDPSGQNLHHVMGVTFRWNAAEQRYTVVKMGDSLAVGEAIWVYYPETLYP